MTEASELYYYDTTSPTRLRWKVDIYSGRCGNIKNVGVGDVAGGYSSGSGYHQVRKNGVLTLVHRLVWELHYGEIPSGMFIDHINGDALDNEISNLRLVTREGNARNVRMRKDNTSGITGIKRTQSKNRNGTISYRWSASCGKKVKSFSIGKFGEEGAKRLAIEWREEQLKMINSASENPYTERHGSPQTQSEK